MLGPSHCFWQPMQTNVGVARLAGAKTGNASTDATPRVLIFTQILWKWGCRLCSTVFVHSHSSLANHCWIILLRTLLGWRWRHRTFMVMMSSLLAQLSILTMFFRSMRMLNEKPLR